MPPKPVRDIAAFLAVAMFCETPGYPVETKHGRPAHRPHDEVTLVALKWMANVTMIAILDLCVAWKTGLEIGEGNVFD